MVRRTRSGVGGRLRWARLVGTFIVGQSAIQLVNFVAGLLMVQLLPVNEYALYTVAGALLAFISLGANMGVTQAVITLGSTLATDRWALGSLFNSALPRCRFLFGVSIPVVLVLALLMFVKPDWPLYAKIVCVALVAASGWLRIPTMVASAILNIRHDSLGLFWTGMSEALARAALAPLCFLWPYAVVGIVANFVGVALASRVTTSRARSFVDVSAPPHPTHNAALKAFANPLIAIIIYTAIQAQISIMLLSFLGNTTAVAGVGALLRFNQLIAIAMMLNPFLVQPVLARQTSRALFLNYLGLIVATLISATVIVLASAYLVPHWWLFILGSSYAGLERELPVALATSMVTLLGGTFYTAVISRGHTSGQHLAILPSIAGQVLFIAFNGVHTIMDALIINLIPAVVYAVVQAFFLLRLIQNWTAAHPTPAMQIPVD